MKFIQKLNEPPELTHWKKQQQLAEVNCNYGCLQNPEKQKVHESLLKEQGYICCYCCNRIEKSSSHIEHFAPQSSRNNYIYMSSWDGSQKKRLTNSSDIAFVTKQGVDFDRHNNWDIYVIEAKLGVKAR